MTTNMDSYLGVPSLAFPVDCRKRRLPPTSCSSSNGMSKTSISTSTALMRAEDRTVLASDDDESTCLTWERRRQSLASAFFKKGSERSKSSGDCMYETVSQRSGHRHRFRRQSLGNLKHAKNHTRRQECLLLACIRAIGKEGRILLDHRPNSALDTHTEGSCSIKMRDLECW